MIFPPNATTTAYQRTITLLTTENFDIDLESSGNRTVYGYSFITDRFITSISLGCGSKTIFINSGSSAIITGQQLTQAKCIGDLIVSATAGTSNGVYSMQAVWATTTVPTMDPTTQFYSTVCDASMQTCYKPLDAQIGIFMWFILGLCAFGLMAKILKWI